MHYAEIERSFNLSFIKKKNQETKKQRPKSKNDEGFFVCFVI